MIKSYETKHPVNANRIIRIRFNPNGKLSGKIINEAR